MEETKEEKEKRLNRERVKKFRKTNKVNRITIDPIPEDFEANLKKVSEITGLSQGKALNQLMIEFIKISGK